MKKQDYDCKYKEDALMQVPKVMTREEIIIQPRGMVKEVERHVEVPTVELREIDEDVPIQLIHEKIVEVPEVVKEFILPVHESRQQLLEVATFFGLLMLIGSVRLFLECKALEKYLPWYVWKAVSQGKAPFELMGLVVNAGIWLAAKLSFSFASFADVSTDRVAL